MATPMPFVKTALVTGLAAPLRQARAVLLDQLYPPTCLACNAPVGEPDTLCAHCFSHLKPITPPYCQRLGIPFAASVGEAALSAEAIADLRSRIRAALAAGRLDEDTCAAAEAELAAADAALRTDTTPSRSRLVIALKKVHGLLGDVADLASAVLGVIALVQGR